MKKIFILVSLAFLGFCIPKKTPQLQPMALLGSIPKVSSYTLEDIGLISENETEPNSSQEPSGLPLISDRERSSIQRVITQLAEAGNMTKEYWESTSQESMKLLSEEGFSEEMIGQTANAIVEGKEVPVVQTASKEEMIRRETARGKEYFQTIQAKFPEMNEEHLIILRENLTVNLALIRLQTDFNSPEGLPPELLIAIRDITISFRKEVTKEMERRGMKNL